MTTRNNRNLSEFSQLKRENSERLIVLRTCFDAHNFPQGHWKRLRTNREIKRKSRVVQVFPSVESLERLAGIVMCEQDDAWSESRYFSERNMAELYTDKPAPSPDSGRDPEELAAVARKTILASLDLADQVDEA